MRFINVGASGIVKNLVEDKSVILLVKLVVTNDVV